ncbi:MAG: DNA topoisomerase IB [Gemmatimonadota bacterium]
MAENGTDTTVAEEQREAAEAAGLRYGTDERPGLRRKRRGRGWSYHRPDGSLIRDEKEKERIRALAIPPAWTEVWIASDRRSHLQATGRDDRGRKQYRYHPIWDEVRDTVKFERLRAFGHALPTVRDRVDEALRQRSLSRERVLAAVVALLEMTAIRVGNDEYARENDTYGLTTIRRRHVVVEGDRIEFDFEAKGGKEAHVVVRDARLARVVDACRELPGYEVFKWVDEEGERHDVKSRDVNEFLRDITGEPFTAKDFRTWLGTVQAFCHLCGCEEEGDEKARAQQCVEAVDAVAERLRNTRAVARSAYIHPAVLDLHAEGELRTRASGRSRESGLSPEEAGLLALLDDLARKTGGGA